MAASDSNFAALDQLEKEVDAAYNSTDPDLFDLRFQRLISTYRSLKRPQEMIWTYQRYGYDKEASELELRLWSDLKMGLVVDDQPFGPNVLVRLLTLENGTKALFRKVSSEAQRMDDSLPYRIAKALGFPLVSLTTSREYKGRLGSIQILVQDTLRGTVNFKNENYTDERLHIFDYITEQLERDERATVTAPGGYTVAVNNNIIYGSRFFENVRANGGPRSSQTPPSSISSENKIAVGKLKKFLLATPDDSTIMRPTQRDEMLRKIEILLGPKIPCPELLK